MGKAAVDAARAVGYVGAGTVEFIANQDGTFYFMEMNTRLQVEHPVTEMITGLDLVEWQLRVASGEPLPMAQEQLAINGHALEARIYAEDPPRLPALHRPPAAPGAAGREHARARRHRRGGGRRDQPFYDPMIAKLIVWDVNRDRALARMLQALADYRVVGVANNVEFLSRLTACPAFANADLDTGLIEREKDYLFPEQAGASREAWLAVALAELLRERERAAQQAARHPEPASPWHQRDGWRLNTDARRSLIFRLGDEQKLLSVESRGNAFAIGLDGVTSLVSGSLNPRGLLRAEFDGLRTTATVVVAGERRHVFGHGRAWQFAAVDPLHHAGEGGGAEGGLLAPMPGKVIALIAEAGATVEKGAPL
jgi:3-methylcrotonyl-CoA carboxylase alpha subunit